MIKLYARLMFLFLAVGSSGRGRFSSGRGFSQYPSQYRIIRTFSFLKKQKLIKGRSKQRNPETKITFFKQRLKL